ncbi:low-density lipoprotein receptor-related protein 2-like [Antedon mediterranea]|uniref:low-density lipoprotein receptor-related protein 2-like n=1 Tax=Antedon mediterranea TaxID=105859 RepID=UPI003AF617D3
MPRVRVMYAALCTLILSSCIPVTYEQDSGSNTLYMTMHNNMYAVAYIGWIPVDQDISKTDFANDHLAAHLSRIRNWNVLAADYSTETVTFHDTEYHMIFLNDDLIGGIGYSIESGTSGRVDGLAIDWLAKNVYWVDEGYNWIKMTGYDLESAEILIADTGLERPSGIACHPLKGYLFWTEIGNLYPSKIERSTMSGKSRTTLISTNLNEPKSITVDVTTNRIYWIDISNVENKIESADLDGSERRVDVSVSLPHGEFKSITVDENYIYVILVESLETYIRCYDKTASNNQVFQQQFPNEVKVFDISVAGTSVQPIPEKLPCVTHTCSHACVSAPDGNHECVCKINYELLADGTCLIDDTFPQPPFYVIGTNVLSRFVPSVLHFDSEDKQQYISDFIFATVTALTVDIRGDLLFFADEESIYVGKLRDGNYIVSIRSGIGQVYGMAVDWVSDEVYWVDYQQNILAKHSYLSEKYSVLFYDVNKPTAIAVDPNAGFIFWTEETSPAKLSRCDLDGTNRQILVLTTLQQPSGIALDHDHERIYIAGKDDTLVYSVNYDGTGHTAVGRSMNPASDITIYQDFIVLAGSRLVEGKEKGIVEALYKETGDHEGYIKLNYSVSAIDIFDESSQPIIVPTTIDPTTTLYSASTNRQKELEPTKEPGGISYLIIAIAAGGSVVLVLLMVFIVVLICCCGKKRTKPVVSSPNQYETDIAQLNGGDHNHIYEALGDMLKPPPTYESSIGAAAAATESPYLKAMPPPQHQVHLQDDTAFYVTKVPPQQQQQQQQQQQRKQKRRPKRHQRQQQQQQQQQHPQHPGLWENNPPPPSYTPYDTDYLDLRPNFRY